MQTNFRTLELAIELHLLIKPYQLPPYQKDQLNRACQSIALNLSEGAGRFSKKEKRRFYRMAFGSLREVQTIFKLADIQDEAIWKQTDLLAANIYKLITA